MRTIAVRNIFLLIPLLLVAVLFANAQDTGVEQGIKPYGAYHGGDIDSISLGNGNLTLHIPLISYPQRGGKLRVGFSVLYQNLFYTNTDNCTKNPLPNCVPHIWVYHLTYGQPYPNGAYTPLSIVPDFYPTVSNLSVTQDSGVKIIEPDGAVHPMGRTTGQMYASMDASGYKYSYDGAVFGDPLGTGTIIDRHGTRYSFPYLSGGCCEPNYPGPISKIEDVDGNVLTPNYNANNGLVSWTDTLGRTIPLPAGSPWILPGPNGGTTQFNISGTFIGANDPITYVPPGCATNCTVMSAPRTLLQSIVLPNGTAWTFDFDNTGALSKITLPTGGSISYTWNINSSRCVPDGDVLLNYGSSATARTLDANDGSGGHTWNYALNWTGSAWQNIVTDPNLNDSVHTLTGGCSAYETELDQYNGTHTGGTLLKKTVTTYNSVADPFQSGVQINVVPLTITTTDMLSGKTSQVVKTYDSGIPLTVYAPSPPTNALYGNVLTEQQYDYGNGVPGALLRTTATQYLAFANSGYLNNNLLDVVSQTAIFAGNSAAGACGSNGAIACTYYSYDENTPTSSGITMQHDSISPAGTIRGNLTSVHHWLNSGTFTCPGGGSGGSNPYIVSSSTYYDTGKVATASDPCGHSTSYLYSSTYYGAFPTTVTNALGQQSTNAYDFNTGAVTSTTDPNQLVTSYSYDSMARLLHANHPDGGQDTITRQETTPPFTATLTSTINTSQNKIPLNVFDGLGRVNQTQLTSDPQGIVYTDTTYDALGRMHSVSNPYRSSDATSSPGVTTYTYDALGRKTQETYPDGSVLTTAYCGPNTLVTDPTGKWRRSRVNGLGQLVEVDEPNAVGATVASTGCPGTGEAIWVTSYTNDVLGNLKQVVQNGSHTRTFTYDSLSRLLTSANPETGTFTYTYNPDGTVLTKRDARAITTTYTYDALHRETGVGYSNGDPSLAFTYDGSNCLNLSACHNIGHRTGMTDGAGSEAWAYQVDNTNSRSIHREQRTTNSSPNNITKTTTYYLDLAGNVTQLVYPTGRTVNYTHDSADRPSSATDASNGITYAAAAILPMGVIDLTCPIAGVCYTPQGSIYSMSIGQGSSPLFVGMNVYGTYNNRLQPQEIRANSIVKVQILYRWTQQTVADMDITYNFVDPTTSKNAGHVYGIANNLNSSRSQAFTYDQLNRIVSAGTTATTGTYCWGNQYSYDAYGNLLSQAGWTPTYNSCTEYTMTAVTADGSNHISGLSYDAAGNTLGDGNYTYTWDGESQMKTAGGVTYAYDGDGRRVAKSGAVSKLYWYGSGGEILSETDAAGNTLNDYVFFGGKRVALVPATGSVLYYAEDLLGSSRVIVQADGTLCYDGDFTPYGGEKAYTSTCAQNYKFEGKERDTETLNDDFGAREYSWRSGRWLSSDWSADPEAVPYADLTNPQTLNLYSMVADDPESFADLDGHEAMFGGTPAGGGDNNGAAEQCNGAVQSPGCDLFRDKALTKKSCPVGVDACVTESMPPPPPTEAHTIPYPFWWEWRFPAIGRIVGTVGTVARAGTVPLIILSYLVSPPYPTAKDTIGPLPPLHKEDTPKTKPSKFRPIRGKPGKVNVETGEVWERDPSAHGGEHYEVYDNIRDYGNRIRGRQVWADGTPGKKY